MSAERESASPGPSIGVVDPVGQAVNTVLRTLFQGQGAGRWLAWGACAFLVAMAHGGAGIYEQAGSIAARVAASSIQPNVRPELPAPGGAQRTPWDVLQRAGNIWLADVRTNSEKYVYFGVTVAALFVPLWLAFQWLGARGRFMFIDNLVHDGALVKQPWAEYRRQGNSLFVLNVLLSAILLPVKAAIPAAMIWTAWPDIAAKTFGDDAKRSLYIGVPAWLTWYLVAAVLRFAAEEFLPPIMYRRRLGWMAACGVFRREILAAGLGQFLLCFLFYVLLQIGAGSVINTLNCVTCCAGAWPYVQQVITLPVAVFLQAYFLHYLEQFGPAWKFFSDPVTAKAAE